MGRLRAVPEPGTVGTSSSKKPDDKFRNQDHYLLVYFIFFRTGQIIK